jgi:hypothetical protein
MRLVVKSWVTATVDCDALNFATRLLKYGTTSGFVSSKMIPVVPPDEEEHPAARPGTASAAAPSPAVFIIVRRLIMALACAGGVPVTVPCVGTGRCPPDRALFPRRISSPPTRGTLF